MQSQVPSSSEPIEIQVHRLVNLAKLVRAQIFRLHLCARDIQSVILIYAGIVVDCCCLLGLESSEGISDHDSGICHVT